MDDRNHALVAALSALAPTGKEAEATLHAIVRGEADAIVVETRDGPRVYTLRDASEPYRELVERMPGAAVVLDAEGTILYCNGGLGRVLGERDLSGRKFLPLVARDQRLLARKLLDGGRTMTAAVELNLLTASGAEAAVRASAAPMSFDGEPCVALVVTPLADIEALKISTAAFHESERRFQLALANSPIAVFEQDLELRYTWVFNPKLGYKVEEIIGKRDIDIIDPSCAPALSQLKRRVIATRRPERQEVAVARPGGPLEYYDLYVEPRCDEGGRVAGVICAATETTERKRAEQASRESAERLRFALSGAQAAAWRWDVVTGELAWSPECFALYGRDPEQGLARYDIWRDCLHPDDLEPTENIIRDVMQQRSPEYRAEYRVVLPGGEIRWLAALGRMEYDEEGAPLRMSGINLDITPQVAAKAEIEAAKAEAERANLAKSKFLAAASHDLRQPVQSLILLLSLLGRQAAGHLKIGETIRMMESAVGGLNGLLTGILDISRLDAGVVAPDMQPVDLGALIAPLGDEYRQRAASKALQMRIVPRRLWAHTDPALLQRALRNLIENALRYTPRGGVLIGARSLGSRVRIDVIDTGIGVSRDQQKLIFDEFFQAGNPGRIPGEGLGLGLAIVSRVVNLLGGEVEVRSRLGQGSRFSLLLPAAQPCERKEKRTFATDAALRGHVLVIEDNANVRGSLDAMLKDWGCAPQPVASGEFALELAAREHFDFDAIVVDYRLGAGLTGVEAAREIARRAGRAIPTMVLTGDTGKEQIAEIEDSGFTVMHKPLEADALRRELASLLKARKSPAAQHA